VARRNLNAANGQEGFIEVRGVIQSDIAANEVAREMKRAKAAIGIGEEVAAR
jgi:hypothetical protein